MRGRLPKVKEYTGDGSNSVNLDFGFQPVKVEVYNITDGDVIAVSVLKGDGTTYSNKVASTAGPATISSNAPEITQRGYKTGTDASLIESAKDFLVVAY